VGTRLKKLESGQYDAIILAAAGLKRLGESAKIRTYLAAETWIPAVGQGVITIECRENDARVLELLQPLDHLRTRQCVLAERAFNARLDGGCQLPIAAHAVCHDRRIHLTGFVANPNKNESLRAELTGAIDEAAMLGKTLAETLLAQGAAGMLENR
jgi:hydroxymethylbilane synthase